MIAKLFRCPSRSVNQSSTYSTFSSSTRFSTACRASGSDVARALLSIIAIVVLSLFADAPTLPLRFAGCGSASYRLA